MSSGEQGEKDKKALSLLVEGRASLPTKRALRLWEQDI